MKIVVFAPHPDDEIFSCAGSILKWLKEGHNVHIVYVTDNRALITWGKKNNQIIIKEAQNYINLSDDQMGEIGLREAKSVAKAFGFPNTNVHLFEFFHMNIRVERNKLCQRVILFHMFTCTEYKV